MQRNMVKENVLSQYDFPNYGLGGGSYGCSPISQGISSGYSNINGEYLDGMWLDVPVGTCNGNYIVIDSKRFAYFGIK